MAMVTAGRMKAAVEPEAKALQSAVTDQRGIAHNVPQYVTLAIVVIVLLWLSIGVTADLVFGRSRSDIARLVWPIGASSLAGAASALAGPRPDKVEGARAAALARAALSRDPTSAFSARILAVAEAMQDDQAAADASMAYAERLSRRDLPTQLYLIEREVAKGDVVGALRHYDRALRTWPSARPELLPIVAHASDGPIVSRAIEGILGQRPNWWFDFMRMRIVSARSASALAAQAYALRLDPSAGYDRDILLRTMARLVELKSYDLAARISPDRPVATMLREGNFEEAVTLPPFGWSLRDDGDVSASREANNRGHGRFVLRLTSTAERGGTVATQLLILKPGGYRLTGLAGDMPARTDDAPVLSLACVDRGITLGTQSLAATGSGGVQHFTMRFIIPERCPAQMLKIELSPTANVDAWVDAFDVRPSR